MGDATSDLVTFIPYTVAIDFDVTDSFEVIFSAFFTHLIALLTLYQGILLLNESNWVDPSEKNPENVEAAIVGSHFNTCKIFLTYMKFVGHDKSSHVPDLLSIYSSIVYI